MIYLERLTEPFHLNIISFFVLLFGSFKQRVAYDLVARPEYAYGILQSALKAKLQGLKGISIIEIGVANGGGLMNMIEIAKKVSKATDIKIKIYGFDTGKGMPKPIDYRDHPELYSAGDFSMNIDVLKAAIKDKAELILGDIKEQIDYFKNIHDTGFPIGFVSVDVDYYSSTVSALRIFELPPEHYLSLTYVYFDDIYLDSHNSKCGQLLAIKEWNERNKLRVVEPHVFLKKHRILKKAGWIDQIYFLHVLDAAARKDIVHRTQKRIIENPYVSFDGNKNRFEKNR